MNKKNKHYIIPIFVPHYGCKHDCTFCNQRRITGIDTDVDDVFVKNKIESFLNTIPEDAYKEVAFFGGSFTGMSIKRQTLLLSVAAEFKKAKLIDAIRLSTRPDYINVGILNNLKEHLVDIIELGVQSMSQDVLDASERGHSIEDVHRSASLIKSMGFKLGLQMMVGLPGDSDHSNIFTATEFIKLKPFCVRIYPTLVIKETQLCLDYEENRYTPMSIESTVEICSKLLMLFNINKINVIRVGLMNTENIQLGKDVVAGPIHPAFRQLVEANINKIILTDVLNRLGDISKKDMIIYSKKEDVSSIVGQHAKNIKFLKEKYSLNKIKFLEGEYSIEIDGLMIKIDKDSVIREHLKSEKLLNGVLT